MDLSEDDLKDLDIPLEAFHQSQSAPFQTISSYVSRQRETSIISDLLSNLLSDDQMP